MSDTRIARWSARAAFPALMALGLGVLVAPSASARPLPVSVTFTYTGHTQTWTVPAGVTRVEAVIDGAAGGDGAKPLDYVGGGGTGGAGSQVTTELLVTPGEVLTISVGQGGSEGHLLGAGSGGAGGTSVEPGGYGGTPDNFFSGGGGGGGGASAVFSGTHVLAVAGGGGGGGGAADISGGRGGDGGTGGAGADGSGPGHGAGGGAGAAAGTDGENGGAADHFSFAGGGGGGGGGWPKGGAGGHGGTYGEGGGGGGGAGASGADPNRTFAATVGVSPLTASVAADGRVTLTYQPPGLPTVTTVTVSPAAPVYGQLVTLTIHVTSGGQPVESNGLVEVIDSNSTFDLDGDLPSNLELCFPGANAVWILGIDGTAACNLADKPVGGHDWYARFISLTGDYASSIGDVVVHIDQAPTTTTLTSSPAAPLTGQPVTLTATVARAASAGDGLSTDSAGTVTFRDGSTVLCQNVASRSIPSSVFDCPLPAGLPGGGHDLTATWTPDAAHSGFEPSTGSLHEDLSRSTTHVSVVSSARDGGALGAPVTFTATVTPDTPTGASPTGTLQFVVDGAPSGPPFSLTPTGGTSEPVTGLAPGAHTVTVDYSGDATFAPSTSAPFQQQVDKGTASVAVTSSAPDAALGTPVTFTAAVAPVAPASVPATGSVQFTVDGTPYGSAVPLSGGTASSAPLSGLAPGAHTVTAAYAGDGNYAAATSPALTQQVDSGAQAVTTAQSRGLLVTAPTVVAHTSVKGQVTVSPGASLALTGATINGPLRIDGASAVRICGSTIRGPVTITGTTGPVLIGDPHSRVTGCAGNTFWGPVTVVGSAGGTVFDGNRVHGKLTISGGKVRTEIGGNTVRGPLACRVDTPRPVNGGRPNTVSGPRLGQCSARRF